MATASFPEATLNFLAGWREQLHGHLAQGGRLTLEYDPERLPVCRGIRLGVPSWDIRGFVRFSPSGQQYEGSLVRGADYGKPVEPKQPAPFTVPVPPDASRAELWFVNIDARHCIAWDSRFGRNYRYDVARHGPLQSVSYRPGAAHRLEMVNVVADAVTKRNMFPRGEPSPSVGIDLETWLTLTAWVKNVGSPRNVWVDVHVFDAADALLHAATLPLGYRGPTGGGGDLFVFEGKVYQGAVATPGSVSPRPDARLLQYRLYSEVNGRVFTDAILHQHNVPEDDLASA